MFLYILRFLFRILHTKYIYIVDHVYGFLIFGVLIFQDFLLEEVDEEVVTVEAVEVVLGVEEVVLAAEIVVVEEVVEVEEDVEDLEAAEEVVVEDLEVVVAEEVVAEEVVVDGVDLKVARLLLSNRTDTREFS